MTRKELLHILRDPRSLIMALALPMMMILLFGYALTLDVDRIPTLIYDADRSPQSRDLIDRFRGSRFFEVVGFVEDYQPIEQEINKDTTLLGVVIPRTFSRDILSGHEAKVQLILDGSDSNTASIALGYSTSVMLDYNLKLQWSIQNVRAGIGPQLPSEARPRIWYNSELKSKNFIVPGLIALILMIIAALLTSLTVAREWEMGTMEQLISTPVRPAEVVLGKMSAFFILGIVDTLTAILAGVVVFEVPLRGNILFLAATCFIFLVGALCWGILLSATARTQLLAYQLGMLTSFLPAFMLSGFVFAIENMPVPVQVTTYLFPTRYFVTILKGVFLKGVGMEVLWLEVVWLLVYATLIFLIATRRLRQKVA